MSAIINCTVQYGTSYSERVVYYAKIVILVELDLWQSSWFFNPISIWNVSLELRTYWDDNSFCSKFYVL